jgi:phosphatidylserine decarboxylase
MAVVLVGAMVVASIETVWEGLVTPPKRTLKHFDYAPRDKRIDLAKGEEMGRFKVGSTAIVLFGSDKMQWNDSLQAGSRVCMGEQLGTPLA